MESSGCKVLLAALFLTATLTEAMYIALPRMGRSAYIAFPRMGRSYLAFPRMGRSGGNGASGSDVSCCPLGLKTEWQLEEGGKTSTEEVCTAASCCEGLQEVMDQKPNGGFYSLCLPHYAPCPKDEKMDDSSEAMLSKLKRML